MLNRLIFLVSISALSLIGYLGQDIPELSAVKPKTEAAEAEEEPKVQKVVAASQGDSPNPFIILESADDLAEQSYFRQAIALAEFIPPEHHLFEEATDKKDLWANEILERGKNKLEEGKTEYGINLLKTIPPSLPASKEAEVLISAVEK